MGSIDYHIKYELDDIILSIGYYTTPELKELYAKTPPKYLQAHEPRPDIYEQYVKLSQTFNTLNPVMLAVTGDGRDSFLTIKRQNTSICFDKPNKKKNNVKTVSLEYVIKDIINKYDYIDKLMMNCEGSEIDIIMNTPSEILKLCKKIVVSFHLFVPEFKITKLQYRNCLDKLNLTHTGRLLHKTRYWWEFDING